MKTLSLVILSGCIAVPAFASPWNSANDPSKFANDYEYRLTALPDSGTLSSDKTPWSETYWPENQGSINYRWNAPHPDGFKNDSPSKEAALQMSREQLAILSPAEKYDLAMGHYDYPLTDEVKGHSNRLAAAWHGICNGWSPAALQYREPKAVDVINPDGIVVPFGSSDVKGLLSFFMAFHAENLNVAQVGTRCRLSERLLGLGSCSDTNPGAFHVILTNEIGARNEGFVADIDPGAQVWNQPVYGYKINSMASTEADGSASAVMVSATLFYTNELDQSLWTPVNGTKNFQGGKMELSYRLDLDESGKIVGGKWLSKEFPDFIWKAKNKAEFTGEFSGLSQIYQPSP